jgi:hypothetical protein
MPKTIHVEAMRGMTRKQARMTNNVAHILTGKHGMCLHCAIKMSVAFVWGQDRPASNPVHVGPLCSSACGGALEEFFEETLGSKGEEVTDPDELAMLNESVQ